MDTKKCKYCMSDIPKAAKVCPQCRKKQGPGVLKIVLMAFGALIVLSIIGSLFSSGSSDSDKTAATAIETNSSSADNTNSKTTEKAAAPAPEYISYNVSELNSDLEANALSASDKYKDQYVELTGQLSNIDSSGQYISIKDPTDEWDFIGIQCYIKNDDQLNVVKSLSTDDMVIVKGKIKEVGEVLGYSLDIDEIKAAE